MLPSLHKTRHKQHKQTKKLTNNKCKQMGKQQNNKTEKNKTTNMQ